MVENEEGREEIDYENAVISTDELCRKCNAVTTHFDGECIYCKKNRIKEEIKTFNAVKKLTVKVFEFTKDMLPKIDKEVFGYSEWYKKVYDFNKFIEFRIWKDGDIDCILLGDGTSEIFEVGDYIAEDREGNFSIITREEFKRDWILPCGHTIKEHKQFQHLSPEEQEILQNECDCEVQE